MLRVPGREISRSLRGRRSVRVGRHPRRPITRRASTTSSVHCWATRLRLEGGRHPRGFPVSMGESSGVCVSYVPWEWFCDGRQSGGPFGAFVLVQTKRVGEDPLGTS